MAAPSAPQVTRDGWAPLLSTVIRPGWAGLSHSPRGAATVLGRVTHSHSHTQVPFTLQQGKPVGWNFSQKKATPLPHQTNRDAPVFQMQRNPHTPARILRTRPGGKGPGAGQGITVVGESRGEMVCALWGRSWSPWPPRSQFSAGGITWRNP